MRPVSPARISGILNSGPDRRVRSLLSRSSLVAALTLAICASSAIAQAPAAGSNWDHLKALPPNTKLHVSGDTMSHTCKLTSVDDASLVCGKYTFPRAEVKKVKMARYSLSYGVGAAIGAGAGAGIGLGLAQSTQDGFFKDSKGQFAGVGAGVGAALGALATGPADLFRGPTVYRRQ